MKENDYIQIALPFTGDEEWYATRESFLNGWLTQGPKVAIFEEKFAKIHEVKYALATTSCTTSLHLALEAIGAKAGDKVIVPSFTWIATANVVEYAGCEVIFCDVNPKTYNIDTDCLENIIERLNKAGQLPKAIIPVHLFGLCSDMDLINRIAGKYNIKVIEDAACAIGAKYKHRPAGSLGDIGCFSFHPRKIITTGEGGMCTTNSPEYYEKMNCLRNHGASVSEEIRHFGSKPYLMPDFNELGYNYRMTDIQGAIGIVQLGKLEMLLKERQNRAQEYNAGLKELEWLITPYSSEDCFHSYQSYVCVVDEEKIGKSRNEIMEILHKKGIATRPGTHAIHELGYYKNKYKIQKSDYPVSSSLYAKTMAIPLHNKMSSTDYEYVIKILKEI